MDAALDAKRDTRMEAVREAAQEPEPAAPQNAMEVETGRKQPAVALNETLLGGTSCT